jgi:hypothetical protein
VTTQLILSYPISHRVSIKTVSPRQSHATTKSGSLMRDLGHRVSRRETPVMSELKSG